MSEFAWYSRLTVWAGILILLVQSLAGRGTSFMTVLAVVFLIAGLPAFLVSLAHGNGPVAADGPHPVPGGGDAVSVPEGGAAPARRADTNEHVP